MENLTIVMPCYNEETRLARTFEIIIPYIAQHDIELILVDDGSTDNTLKIMQREALAWAIYKKVKFITYVKNQGKGFAVKKGIEAATKKYIA